MRTKLCCMLVLIVCCLSYGKLVHAATWVITYPQATSLNDPRQNYPIELLHLALEKTGVQYHVKASSKPLSQAKSLRKLRENIDVNVVWSMTDVQREADLLPIRIPLDKGLIGWRVFMTHKNKPFYRKNIESLDDLLVYSPIQVTDWPDTKILQANGFNVLTAQSYQESLSLLARQQADFFPRSVMEASAEMGVVSMDDDIRLRRDIAIVYPSAMYFFVNKRNKTLANLLATGLRRAIDDGSFEQLFDQHHKSILSEFDMPNIRVWRLENPLLPPLTPLDDHSLWYRPASAD